MSQKRPTPVRQTLLRLDHTTRARLDEYAAAAGLTLTAAATLLLNTAIDAHDSRIEDAA